MRLYKNEIPRDSTGQQSNALLKSEATADSSSYKSTIADIALLLAQLF